MSASPKEQGGLTASFDASSLILLYKAAGDQSALWNAIARLYRCIVPAAVLGEINRPGYSGASFFVDPAQFFSVQDIKIETVPDSLQRVAMGSGEKSAIALYYAGLGDFVVVDDRRAAQFCRKESVPYVNALLLPRLLIMAGVLSREAGEAVSEKLVRLGRYGGEIIRFARQCPDESLQPFLPEGRRNLRQAGRSVPVFRRDR